MPNAGDNNNILLLLAVGAIVILLINMNKKEHLDVSASKVVVAPVVAAAPRTVTIPEVNEAIFKPVANEQAPQGPAMPANFTLGVDINDPKNSKFSAQAPREQAKLTSGDLLPGKPSEKWFDTPEVGVKIEDANLLADALTKVGVDTVGQTRKNPSYDLRGTIPCPKFVVSPWNNSTYEADVNLKSLY
jgi:hypothetical protein